MRVTHSTPDTLVIEDAPDVRFGWGSAALGAAGLLVGLTQPSWIFVIAGAAFVLFGLKISLFAPTTTHRFERQRGVISIDTTGRRRSASRRELPLDSIADVVLQQKQVRGGEAGVRYWVEYVTRQGGHIAWGGFTGSRDDKLECVTAAREFLGTAPAAPPSATAPTAAGEPS